VGGVKAAWSGVQVIVSKVKAMSECTRNPSAVVVDTTRSPFCRLRPLSLTAVRLDDAFWAPRRRVNHAVSLPTQYELCQTTGRLDNFRRAAGCVEGPFQGRFFNDSDVYKWIEAAAWTLASEPDGGLSAQVDDAIALIAAAQDDVWARLRHRGSPFGRALHGAAEP
jgi:DUF1680 family protein